MSLSIGCRYLFVYGSLLKKINHPLHKKLARHSDFLGNATTRGRLFNVGAYPGLALSGKETGVVRGELYQLRQRRLILSILDRYEGCGPQAARPHEYRREIVPVELIDGQLLLAWTYIYNRPTSGLQTIAGGDYLEFRKHSGKNNR